MKTVKLVFTLMVFACFNYPAFSQERLKVGLVLSGGGARGAAHVGVLKVLEEMQIPIDVIAGTSMGSIVGGLYASGMSPAEIEDKLNTMDWDEALSDAQGREYLSLNRKRQEDLFTINLKAGFNDGSLDLPPGVILGQNIDLALQRLTAGVEQITDFDNLPIPFRAVATDLAKGDPVVLSGGSLATAMRASMSVPSLFAPVHLNGQILVDGGLTNNLPVEVARQMGAQVIIAIDISTPLRDATELTNLLAVTDQLTRLLTGQNTRRSRENLTESDFLLIPDVGDITASAFNRSSEAIAIGEAAARSQAQALSRFALADEEYQTYLAGLNRIEPVNRTVLQITVNNQSKLSDQIFEDMVSTQSQEALDISTLEADVNKIYGLGYFEKVGYRLTQKNDGTDIEIYATPKSWGPNYLHFGFEMDIDGRGNSDADFTFGYTRSEMNALGAEWTSLLQVGSEPKLQSYLHQPISANLKFFVEPYLVAGQKNFGLFTPSGNETAEARVTYAELGFIVGREFGSQAILSLGASRLSGETEILVGDPLLADENFNDGGVFINFSYDTLDSISFPSRGNVVSATVYKAYESFGAQQEFDQWRLDFTSVKSWGQHTFILGASAGGTENGPASISKLFSIGGIFNLSGLKEHQRSGQFLGLLKAAYYRRFDKIKILPVYLGISVEYGNVWVSKDDINHDNSILGNSVFIGLDSPIGPVLFGVGFTENGDSNIYAKVGKVF